jgi:ABC-type uncharacterized transport system substrate-binding protein
MRAAVPRQRRRQESVLLFSPDDIPFYQQTKFELVLNRMAAKSLGLEFPVTLACRSRRNH